MDDLEFMQQALDTTVRVAASYGITEASVRDYQAGMPAQWGYRQGAYTGMMEASLTRAAQAHRRDCAGGCELCEHLRRGLTAAVASLREAQNGELERRLNPLRGPARWVQVLLGWRLPGRTGR
ncbi:hypothetical protein Ade02nite_20740 [Paractinoplanes deccanensis]|uniref:Uncharacterized protein n=1 Tax=Paractinoplanes deccanensis TaxID=113561 RepID=A0ABQ3Y0A3_9ACTN|nr:hypothetical protein [Actinoplanes deccanensis]GID73433.1 hypothetical protein Ade02nite_20740 [Actinoplanes deccanensis]